MKNLALFVSLILLLAGCATPSYQPKLPDGLAKPADYPIPIYNEDAVIPRPCEVIGQFSVNAGSLTMIGGSVEAEMKALLRAAHEKGADVVQMVSTDKPGFNNVNYRIKANLLRYADKWERVVMTEKDLRACLQRLKNPDPIEGIWSDGFTEQLGIIRDRSRPGRDFVAFTLSSAQPAWRKGYKKMDIARGERPGTYNVKYYSDDFTVAETTIALDPAGSFTFNVRTADAAYTVAFVKTNPQPPAN